MSSEFKDNKDPGDPENADHQFDFLLDEVKSIINSTPDHQKQCKDALASVEQWTFQQFSTLIADTKAHPAHKAGNDAKIHKLAITLGNALAAYARCIRATPLKMTEG